MHILPKLTAQPGHMIPADKIAKVSVIITDQQIYPDNSQYEQKTVRVGGDSSGIDWIEHLNFEWRGNTNTYDFTQKC